MKLKTFILTLLAFGFSIMAGAQQNAGKVVVKFEETESDPITLNGTSKDCFFIVSLEDSELLYGGYQMDIHLPAGMEVLSDRFGLLIDFPDNDELYPSSRRGYQHEISSSAKSNNKYTVVCASQDGYEFEKNNGDLFRVYVKASPYMKPGDIDITIDNVVLNHNVWNAEKGMYDAVSYYPSVPCGGTIEGVSGVCNNVPFNVSSAAKWSTCILPFDAEIPAGVTAYTSDDNEDSRVYLRKATSIEAYTPYVLKSEAGYSGTLSGTVNAANYPDGGFVTKGNLNGAIVPQNVTEGYVLQNLSSGVKFYAIGNGSTFNIPAGKCWMTLPAGASAKELNMVIVDEETGIDNVIASPFANDDAIYNLQGMKICKPAARKLYIKNGKKYAINR